CHSDGTCAPNARGCARATRSRSLASAQDLAERVPACNPVFAHAQRDEASRAHDVDFERSRTRAWLHARAAPATGKAEMSESIAAFGPALEHLVAAVMDEWKIPGLAIAVVQDGDAALVKAYGLRDVEAGLPATTDTQFQIASISKSFAATGLAILADEG